MKFLIEVKLDNNISPYDLGAAIQYELSNRLLLKKYNWAKSHPKVSVQRVTDVMDKSLILSNAIVSQIQLQIDENEYDRD